MPKTHALATRWLGVGTATVLAVITVSLALTDRLSLYINPDSSWFAVSMALLVLVGAVASFTLPLGAESDHGHDHGGPDGADRGTDHGTDDPVGVSEKEHAIPRAPVTLGTVAALTGGVLASGVIVSMLIMPPATLSTELAMARDVGAPQLFGGSDVVSLATTGDTSEFGVGDWASVFATATNPDAFEGDTVTLTGFVTPADSSGDYRVSRLVITHCVIDAQQASVAISADTSVPDTGQWVEISGTIRAGDDGTLQIIASDVTAIDEPDDPYEY